MQFDYIDPEKLEKESFSGMTPTPIDDKPLPPAERLKLMKQLLSEKRLPTGQFPYRRPAFLYPGLPSTPIYDSKDFSWGEALTSKTDEIAAELVLLERHAEQERSFHTVWPDYTQKGEWAALTLRLFGELYEANARLCPRTVATIANVPQQGGWLSFSAMAPGTHIRTHCGVSNAKLRCHLGIELVNGDSRIRVHDQMYSWKKSELFVFDDSFEHEIWNDGDSRRVVLLFDIFHPDLTAEEIALLRKIEDLAVKDKYSELMKRYNAESTEVAWMQNAN